MDNRTRWVSDLGLTNRKTTEILYAAWTYRVGDGTAALLDSFALVLFIQRASRQHGHLKQNAIQANWFVDVKMSLPSSSAFLAHFDLSVFVFPIGLLKGLVTIKNFALKISGCSQHLTWHVFSIKLPKFDYKLHPRSKFWTLVVNFDISSKKILYYAGFLI